MIETMMGTIPAKDLMDRAFVVAADPNTIVKGFHLEDMYERDVAGVVTEDGCVVICTPDHSVHVGGGFMTVRYLEEGNAIMHAPFVLDIIVNISTVPWDAAIHPAILSCHCLNFVGNQIIMADDG